MPSYTIKGKGFAIINVNDMLQAINQGWFAQLYRELLDDEVNRRIFSYVISTWRPSPLQKQLNNRDEYLKSLTADGEFSIKKISCGNISLTNRFHELVKEITDGYKLSDDAVYALNLFANLCACARLSAMPEGGEEALCTELNKYLAGSKASKEYSVELYDDTSLPFYQGKSGDNAPLEIVSFKNSGPNGKDICLKLEGTLLERILATGCTANAVRKDGKFVGFLPGCLQIGVKSVAVTDQGRKLGGVGLPEGHIPVSWTYSYYSDNLSGILYVTRDGRTGSIGVMPEGSPEKAISVSACAGSYSWLTPKGEAVGSYNWSNTNTPLLGLNVGQNSCAAVTSDRKALILRRNRNIEAIEAEGVVAAHAWNEHWIILKSNGDILTDNGGGNFKAYCIGICKNGYYALSTDHKLMRQRNFDGVWEIWKEAPFDVREFSVSYSLEKNEAYAVYDR